MEEANFGGHATWALLRAYRWRIQGKAKERVKGIAQPHHALSTPARPPTLRAGRAVVVTEGAQGTKARTPPPLYLLPRKIDAHTRATGWINQGTAGRGRRS